MSDAMKGLVDLVLVLDKTAEEVVEDQGEGPLGSISVEILSMGPVVFDISLYRAADGRNFTMIFDTGIGPFPFEMVLAPEDTIRDIVREWLDAGRREGVVA